MADNFRKVNAILGASPKIGPFPTELIIPWLVISISLFLICYSLLNLPLLWVLLIVAWADTTWWILTGRKPYLFLSKFIPVPRWTRGAYRYKQDSKRYGNHS
jgi:hypothetical protein